MQPLFLVSGAVQTQPGSKLGHLGRTNTKCGWKTDHRQQKGRPRAALVDPFHRLGHRTPVRVLSPERSGVVAGDLGPSPARFGSPGPKSPSPGHGGHGGWAPDPGRRRALEQTGTPNGNPWGPRSPPGRATTAPMRSFFVVDSCRCCLLQSTADFSSVTRTVALSHGGVGRSSGGGVILGWNGIGPLA